MNGYFMTILSLEQPVHASFFGMPGSVNRGRIGDLQVHVQREGIGGSSSPLCGRIDRQTIVARHGSSLTSCSMMPQQI